MAGQVRRRVLHATWVAAQHSGISRIARRATRNHLLVLCYHGLTEGPSTDWLLHPLRDFERELQFVALRYRVLPIDQAVEALYGDGLSEPTAAITFDDGYRNNAKLALPVLRRLNLPATIYLTTGLVDTDQVLWTTLVQHAIEKSESRVLRVGDGRLDGPLGSTPGERAARGSAIRHHLKTLENDQRLDNIGLILEQLGQPTGLDDFYLMSRAELSELDQSGLISFGGHTRTHPILSTLNDTELEDEICGSIEDLSYLSNISRTFAYPNGQPRDYDDRCIRLLQAHEVDAGLSTRQWLHRATFDRYHLRRVVVDGHMRFSDFIASVSGLKEIHRR